MATLNKLKFTRAPSLTNLNNLRSKLIPTASAGLLALGLVAQPAQAAITFNFNYLNPDQGFDDPVFGADRKAALNDAAAALGGYLSNYSATLTYNVNSYNDNTVSTLASADSPSYFHPGTFQQTWVQSKILSNDTSTSTKADGTINWNFAFDWGLGDNVGANQYDFKSTAMHELIHSLGFTSYINPEGTGLAGNTSGTQDTWSTFDAFLTDANGNSLITNGAFDTSLIGALVAGETNSAGVFFNGPNANAANGGAGIPIYSPNPYEPGSSIDHIDDHSAVTSHMVMDAVHNTGQDARVLSQIEIAMLKDIGYTNAAAPAPAPVPVPAAAWLMISGLVGLFGVSRRKAC